VMVENVITGDITEKYDSWAFKHGQLDQLSASSVRSMIAKVNRRFLERRKSFPASRGLDVESAAALSLVPDRRRSMEERTSYASATDTVSQESRPLTRIQKSVD